MIKAIIFDFGNVLVHFDPDYILSENFPLGEDRRLLAPIVFSRSYWDKTDDGSMSEEQVYETISPTLDKKYCDGVRHTLMNWHRRLPEWEGMRELICSLKDRGYPIFVISNISKRFAEHSNEVPILSLADNALYSAEVGETKPSAEIFRLACEKFGYKKEDCVFIDDSPKNVQGAREFGMNAILFDGDIGSLSRSLDELIKVNK